MRIELERRTDCQFVRLSGDLRFWNHAEQEEKVLAAFATSLENTPREVLLNLAEVTAIDSRGISTIVRLPARCAQHNIYLKIVMPRGVPGEAIRRVRVFDAWPTFDEESSAVAAPG